MFRSDRFALNPPVTREERRRGESSMKPSDRVTKGELRDPPQNGCQVGPTRREFMTGFTGATVLATLAGPKGLAKAPDRVVNMARFATPPGFKMATDNKIAALNYGFTPSNSFDSLTASTRYPQRAGRETASHRCNTIGTNCSASTGSRFFGP